MSPIPIYIAVVGSGQCTDEVKAEAREVGRLVAAAEAILICGGLGGVMDAAAEGAKSAGGMTVGILPDHIRVGASRFLDVSIPSGMGEMRNALVVRAADAIIAVHGEYGTLSEIALAMKTGKPVIGLNTWEFSRPNSDIESLIRAKTPKEAVDMAITAVRG
ncbi:MAG: TIGR00725 family protein [Actinomycetota bacterium]